MITSFLLFLTTIMMIAGIHQARIGHRNNAEYFFLLAWVGFCAAAIIVGLTP